MQQIMKSRLFRIHPIMIPFLLFFYLSGEIAVYAIVFGSLIIHELGHLVAAKAVGGRVTSCTILPYGGEIKIEQFGKWGKREQLIVILGGPFFTLVVLLVSKVVDFPQVELLTYTQLVILCLNLLPIYPLDGGRVINSLFPNLYIELISFSLLISLLIFYTSLYYFPKGLFVSLIFLFIALQNLSFWRFRRYKLAFDRITKNA
ncbi:metalloprotease [Psychrobacillus sp. NPDC093200]|uniref:metalloprotease n=1 Tax=Psychrobacillus sp. NPDC093200 TaxID=3390656 RepID=UPI003D032E1B